LVYKWLYLFLVVDVGKGKLYWTWITSMKAEMIKGAVKGLKQQTGVGAVVWDGAPGHRDQRVQELGMPLIGLPPYSPELNPAERVFEEVRRWIEGRVYNSIEDKVKAVEMFLSKLESDPQQVRALTAWDWIGESIHGLPVSLAA
jgi:transposase